MKFHLIRNTGQIPIPVKDRTHIGIHHSASSFGYAELIDSWHRQRGFNEIGYHFIIHNGTYYPMGFIETGRNVNETPAAHKPKNTDSIAIVVIGDFSQTVIDNNLDARAMSLALLVNWLREKKGIELYDPDSPDPDNPQPLVMGHREIAPTQCPGLNIDLKVMRKYFEHWETDNHWLDLQDWYNENLFVYTGSVDQIAAVQRILNRVKKSGLAVDGIAGPLTHGAWTDAVGVETFESKAGEIKGWDLVLKLAQRPTS